MQNRLVLQVERRYNSRKDGVHQSNKVVEAVNEATVYLYYAHGKMCGKGERGW